MTTSEKRILDSITPRVAELVSEGMEIMEATQKAILEQLDMTCEMIEQKTERSQIAMDRMFNRYVAQL